jgi:PAS domain S-box-containing protein
MIAIRTKPLPFILPTVLATTGLIFLGDLTAPPGYTVWVLYLLPLTLSLWTKLRHATLLFAVVSTLFVVLAPPAWSQDVPRDLVIANRAMAFLMIWLAAFLISQHKWQAWESYHAQQMFQLVLDNIPQRVFWKDRNFRYLGCNKPFARDAGFDSPSDLIGKNDFELSWKDTAPLYRADDHHVMESDSPKLNYEEQQHKPDGTVLWLRTSKVPLHDRDSTVIGVLGTYEDFTQHKQVEEALRASEQRFRAVTESTIDAIISVSSRGVIVSWNQAAQHLFGYSKQEILGKPVTLLMPERYRHAHEEGLAHAHATGEFHLVGKTRELCGLRKDFTEFPLEVSLSHWQAGDESFFTAIARDITVRKTMEEELRQAQKMEGIGRLAGGIAHDFNNLMTVINGYCDMLLRQGIPLDRWQRSIQEIKQAGERAAGLTRQLLAFSRKQMLQPKVLDLNVVIRNMEAMLRRLIREDIELDIRLAVGLWLVKADPGQLEQVLMNLVVNARDAMPRGGQLTIKTANVELDQFYAARHRGVKPGAYVTVSVSDTGCGMDEETRSRIFEPFFTTKEPGKGTGLGLSTVYGIVRQSGGYISVFSEPDHGATFTMHLPPVLGESRTPTVSVDSGSDHRGTETILLVEDEPAVRTLARSILEEQGYRVIEASHGEEALLLSKQHNGSIHLLVTDVVMPGPSGPQVAQRLTRHHPRLKVLYMSGYTDDAIGRHGVLTDGTSFIGKPFNSAALARKVRKVLDA